MKPSTYLTVIEYLLYAIPSFIASIFFLMGNYFMFFIFMIVSFYLIAVSGSAFISFSVVLLFTSLGYVLFANYMTYIFFLGLFYLALFTFLKA